jgi:hypothetical protein
MRIKHLITGVVFSTAVLVGTVISAVELSGKAPGEVRAMVDVNRAELQNAVQRAAWADGLALKVTGDARRGYGVTILLNGQPVAHHNGGGEFSAVFQNGEHSLEDRVENWKAASWTGDARHVTLTGECELMNLGSTIFVEVNYEIVTPHVVRKKIRFRQADMHVVFYEVSNRLEPDEPPTKFWSFNQPDCRGGPLHEYYPAAGFRTRDGLTVGLLTDAGYRNYWTRMIRRDRGELVKPAPRTTPDVNLYYVCRQEERAKGQFYLQQTFGDALMRADDGDSGEAVALPPLSSWDKRGEVVVEERKGGASLSVRGSQGGLIIPLAANGGEVYAIRFEYRSPRPLAMRVWDVDEHLRMQEDITLYNDRVPESPAQWSEFRSAVFVPALRGRSAALLIEASGTGLRDLEPIELRGFEVRQLPARHEPYHRLEMDRPEEKTSFLFVDDQTPDTIRGYRLASQLHLSDALGFKGG